MKFMVGLRRGEYKAEQVDDFIDSWHSSYSEESLPSYLGMTYSEYAAWVEQRATLYELVDKCESSAPPRPTLCNRFLVWLLSKLVPGP